MTNPYRKDVRHLDELDLYVLADLYDVKSHAVFHAIKKLICAGKRGAKDYEQDLMEAIESIERELQIMGLKEQQRGPHDHTFSAVGIDAHLRRKFKREKEMMELGQPQVDPSIPRTESFDEQRIDAIGQNGNDGEHYERPWIEHDGGACPLAEGTKVDVRDRDGEVHLGKIVGDWSTEYRWWSWKDKANVSPMFSMAQIVAYRLA